MELIYVAIAVAVGFVMPTQAGVNSSLRQWMPHPLWAALTNFLVGILVLVAALAVTKAPLPTASRLSQAPWWTFVGGILGAAYVLTSVLLARKLGAAVFIGAILAGQLIMSVILDHFGLVGYPQTSVSLGRIGGILLLLAGVWLIRVS